MNTITLPRSVVEQAIEALEYHTEQTRPIFNTELVIEVLRAALAAPQGEPVAWLYTAHDGRVQAFTLEPPPRLKELCKPLYATPQPAPTLEPPEGWKLVPVEPTPEMLQAAMSYQEIEPGHELETAFYWMYRAAVKAAHAAKMKVNQ